MRAYFRKDPKGMKGFMSIIIDEFAPFDPWNNSGKSANVNVIKRNQVASIAIK